MSEKLPRRDADAGRAGRGVDLGEVLVEEPVVPITTGHAALERERDVPAHRRRVRVVDEHVGRAVERRLDVALERDSERVAAERLADVAAGLAPRDRRLQAQIVGRRDRRHELAPDGAEGAGNADG